MDGRPGRGDLEPPERRLLAVTSFPPYPALDGLRLRVCALLRELSADWEISLVAPPPTDDVEETDLEGVAHRVEVPLDGKWTYFPFQYDTAPLRKAVRQEIRRWHPSAALVWTGSEFLALDDDSFPPVVGDRVDCMSLQAWRSLQDTAGLRDLLRRLNTLQTFVRYERRVAGVPYATVVVGEDDARWLRRITGAHNTRVIPNGVAVGPRPEPDQESPRPTVAFTGVMSYAPNVDAVTYFAKEVWPRIRTAVPEAVFLIVGREPAPEVVRLQGMDGVEVTGEVPDMAAALARAWVAVAPMRRGSGIKNKVLEAWAVGTPVVMTRLATNGLRGADEFGELTTDDPERMGQAVIRLLQDLERRERLGNRAYRAARRQSWESAGRQMSRLLDSARRALSG